MSVQGISGKCASTDAHGERGATGIEYALLASLISVASLLSLNYTGTKVATTFERVDQAFPQHLMFEVAIGGAGNVHGGGPASGPPASH